MKDFISVTIHRRGQLNCYCTPFLFLKSLGEENKANKYRERDQDNDCGFTNPLQFDLCGDLSSCIIYYCFFFQFFFFVLSQWYSNNNVLHVKEIIIRIKEENMKLTACGTVSTFFFFFGKGKHIFFFLFKYLFSCVLLMLLEPHGRIMLQTSLTSLGIARKLLFQNFQDT